MPDDVVPGGWACQAATPGYPAAAGLAQPADPAGLGDLVALWLSVLAAHGVVAAAPVGPGHAAPAQATAWPDT